MLNRLSPILLAAAAFCLPFSAGAQAPFIPSRVPPPPMGGAMVTGQISAIVGSNLQLILRNGRSLTVNLRAARAHDLVPPIYQGEFVQVQGTRTADGLTAAALMRAKSAPAAWPADTP
jgi:hypothetical protein